MSQEVPAGLPSSSMTLPQNSSVPVQSQTRFLKIWEGTLSGLRQGQPVIICGLEGYRNASASETLAADWPQTMQIVRLIFQDHVNYKQYVGKADFLMFRALNLHRFLGQMQEKKLCAVIKLPSQILLLTVSYNVTHLTGILFPRVLDEIGVGVPSQLSSVPTGRIAAKKSDDVGSSDMDDLEKMLAALEFLSP